MEGQDRTHKEILNSNNTNKISEELSLYMDVFSKFKDAAAPAPEVEIKVKGSPKEFYEKYLKNDNSYIFLKIDSDSIHVHCKPRHLSRLLEFDEIKYIGKGSELFESM